MASQRPKGEMLDRSQKGRNTLGTAVYVGLRAADPILQYNILSNGIASVIIRKLGGSILAQGPALITNTPIDSIVGLSPYRSILLAMSVTSMLKHDYWKLFLQKEQMPPSAGIIIGMFNLVLSSANSLFFVCSQTSASVNGEHFPQTPLIVGSGLFVVGLFIELWAEVQRKAFKDDPRNKGAVYEGGLFSLARHINYFGDTLWRTGYAMAAGGWTWAAVTAALELFNFSQNSIPELQSYCENRYGAKYEHYKKVVPYKIIPYVY